VDFLVLGYSYSFWSVAYALDKDLVIQLQQQQLIEQQKLIAMLRQLSDAKDDLISSLKQTVSEQGTMILLLEARVTELENNQKKNSSNSSKPPSSDMGKPKQTNSLRTSSGKKPGGQVGHTGETLSFSATPDEIITHIVSHCACCGKSLSGVSAIDCERRQVYDIPPIAMMVTEHQSEIKSCPQCNTINKAAFPGGVSQPVQYGSSVQALAAYLTQYQLLPYGRTAQIFGDLFGHAPSEAFLVNNNKRLAGNLQPFVEALKTILLQEPVLHGDETGYYYKGQRNWLHVLCNEKFTLYMPHAKRGRQAMDEMGVLSRYTGTLVHDHWRAYLEYACKHALCNVHHLRDLTFCEEVLHCTWAKAIKQFLLDLYEKVQQVKNTGQKVLTRGQLQYWKRRYNCLLKKGRALYPPPKKMKGRRGVTAKSKSENLLERFEKYGTEVLAFASNTIIPFGNNLAEQAIRMMKVKQKISGCFRSEQGAIDFATIRSYIATMQKHGVSIIHAIHEAVNGSPRLLSA
jgi:transposase